MREGQRVQVIRSYGVNGKPHLKSGVLGTLADSHKVQGHYVQAYFVHFDDGSVAVVQPKDLRTAEARKRNPRINWGKGVKRVRGNVNSDLYVIEYHKIGAPPHTAEYWEVHYNGKYLGNQGSLKWAKKLAEQHQEKQ